MPSYFEGMYPLVGIVIAVHNARDKTLRCLESLRNITYSQVRIYIVDDGSTDGTWEVISRRYPYVILIKGTGELYWSGGYNKGIGYALKDGCEYILLLNNDCIVEKNFLDVLVKVAMKYKPTIVGPIIYFLEEPNRIFSFGHCFSYIRGVYPPDYNLIDEAKDQEKEVIAMSGNSILVPREVFESGIFLDEKNFPMVYGDLDFCLRARKKGFKIMVTSKSKIWNEVKHTKSVPPLDKNRIISSLIKKIKFYFSFFSLGSPFLIFRFYWRHSPNKVFFWVPIFFRYIRKIGKVFNFAIK